MESTGVSLFPRPDPDAQPNNHAIDKNAPVFVRQVKNAKLYQAGAVDNRMKVIHLWGSAYDKGFALGELLGEELIASWIPPSVQDWIANEGMDVALDWTYDATIDFTNPKSKFYDEMHGMSDGSNCDCFEKIKRIHMLGELTKGQCSLYGAWGSATKQSLDGGLFQVRALDWDTDGPFKNYPAVIVYHSSDQETEGYSFANVGWTGWIGSLTGVSEKNIGIGEIGVAFPDESFGKESRHGNPFTFMLRDLMQWHGDLDSANKLVETTNRTCDLVVGVGSGNDGVYNAFEYSYSVANRITPSNFIPKADWHEPIPDCVYHGMDWNCPSYNQVLHDQLSAYLGTLDAETSIKHVLPIVQTGDLHAAHYSYATGELYVQISGKDAAFEERDLAQNVGEERYAYEFGRKPTDAYNRQAIAFTLADLWAETKPDL